MPHRSHVPPKPDGSLLANGDTHSSMHPVKPQANGYHDSRAENRTIYDDYLAAPTNPAQRDSVNSSNPDGDSVFDLYNGQNSSKSHSQVDVVDQYGHGHGDERHYADENDDPEESKWIHSDTLAEGDDPHLSKWIDREKLARIENAEVEDYLWSAQSSCWVHKDKLEEIENEELEQVGIFLPSSPVANTRVDEDDRGRKPRRVHSPTPDEYAIYGDPRTPEERAANRQQRQFSRNPSYSRIPLASASPRPVPDDYLERRAPLPRTAGTPTGSDDGSRPTIVPPSARKRSYSAGSAMLLGECEKAAPAVVSSQINNPKNSSRNPTSPSPGGRRTSGARTSLKQRTRSNPQLYRPNTSSASASQGPRMPDGPPPWALSSYKPDPSLPQDQQVIPTIAKKMQQDQWERDGVYASVYDRNLRPLKVHDTAEIGNRKNSDEDVSSNEKAAWPLSPTLPPSEPTPEKEPTPPPPKDGGYRAIPNVSYNTF